MFKKEFSKECIVVLKKNADKLLTFSFIFLVMVSVSLFLNNIGFLGIFGTMIGFYFMVIPFLFSLQLMVVKCCNNIEIDYKDFSNNYKSYFSPRFRGLYKAIFSLLKTILVFFVATGCFSIIMYLTNTESLNLFFDEMAKINEYNLKMEYFYENYQTYLVGIDFYILGSYAVSFLAFCYFIGQNIMTPYFAMKFPVNPIICRKVNYSSFRILKKEYLKTTLGLTWPGIILYFVGVALGGLISYFAGFNGTLMIAISISLGILFNFPFLILYLIASYKFYSLHKNVYHDAFKVFIEESFIQIQHTKGLSVEQEKQINEVLNKLAKELEDSNDQNIVENDVNQNNDIDQDKE